MPRPTHSLQRAVTKVVVGAVQGTRARDRDVVANGLSEIMQQYQQPIAGQANTGAGFNSVQVNFDHPFYYAPAQRDPDFEVPHFWFGVECNADVMVTANVKSWIYDSDDISIIGAHITVGVIASASVTYKGQVHLVFQGFSTTTDDATPDEIAN